MLCVRYVGRSRLSYRDHEELSRVRGLYVEHSDLFRWENSMP